MRRLLGAWRNLWHRDQVERDLDDEVRAAVGQLTAEYEARGLSRSRAEQQARIDIGGVETVKQRVREARPGGGIDAVWQDLRYAARLLRRNPLFTLTAVLSLAIGIGATTSIFSVANGLLLRAAAGVPDPGGIVDIVRRKPGDGPGLEQFSFGDLVAFRRQATVFDGVFGYQMLLRSVSLELDDGLTPGSAGIVTSNYFRVLGVRPAAGRVFDDGDAERAGAAPVAVLHHAFWMRRFNGDPRVVGQTVRINDLPLTVVGVAAAGFNGLTLVAPDVWLPIAAVAALSPEGKGVELTNPIPWLTLGARLGPGISRARASAQTAAIGAGIQRATPKESVFTAPGRAAEDPAALVWSAEAASPIPYGMRGVAAAFLAILMALVVIVLVIACINLAGVLLARATTRRREVAVRTAVGAGRVRLMRQFITETVLLFALGGVAGLAIARTITNAVVSLLPAFDFPVTVSAPLDGRVVAFALVLSFLAAVLSGLAPALHASRSDVVTALKDDAQGPSDRLRLRSVFVVAQVAGSILLVVIAGLLVRAFDNTLSTARGFDTRGLDVATLDLAAGGYGDADGREAVRRLLEAARSQRGVRSASIADRAPGGGGLSLGVLTAPGGDAVSAMPTSWTLVEPNYFQTLAIPLISGRDFTDADRAGSESVAIVSRTTAERFWPGRDAVGQTLLVRADRGVVPQQMRVVGIAGDIAAGIPGDQSWNTIYVPLQQKYRPQVTLLLRRDPDGPSLAPIMRQLADRAVPNVAVLEADAFDRTGSGPVETQLRIAVAVASSVGLVGLALAAIGIYGVTAYAVTQRTREIGIRLSLGATRGEVMGLVLRQGMRLVVIGSAIGLALSLAAGRALAGRRFGIPQADPVVLSAAVVLFAIVGLAACYMPVRRAARIRAMEALRYE